MWTFVLGLVPAAFAAFVGYFSVRLTGIHFVIITIIFAQKETSPGSVANGRAIFVDGRTGRILRTLPLFKPLGCCIP